MNKILLIVFCGITLFISCKKDKTPVVACTDTVSFAADIVPIMKVSCSTSGCHDAATAASGYDLTTYTSISASADAILAAMNQGSGVSPMPQGQDKLADSIIAKFDCWKANGALDN